MPTLDFKGKQFVYAHHLTCPFRPLVPVAEKSLLPKGGEPDLAGNLIIRGDNLHALKALLPRYAGRVNCIFIDPPYNTGNEGWCYNDNVRSPLMREWLKKSANPVDKEDLERHDKWLCMMWPRLQLLKDLLAEDGAIFVTIDDNEQHRLRVVMDEVFGEENHVATFIWRKVDSPNDNKVAITPDHEMILCYANDAEAVGFGPKNDASILGGYSTKDENGRLYRDRLLKKNGKNSLRSDRPSMFFPLKDPDGSKVFPIHDNGEEACWAAGEKMVEKHRTNGTLIWKRRERRGKTVWEPYTREFAPDVPTRPHPTIWADLPTMRQAKAMLTDIFAAVDVFTTPKPVELIGRILEIATDPDSLILDSFAGSGTTAHAVLAQNKKDGGNRKFILVECEEYADTLTAERVRRVIQGYEFSGTQREELHRENITFTSLKKAEKILERVAGYEVTDGHRFDKVKAEVKDGVLTVTGEKKVTERTEGLGGSFTYCELGDAVELESMLTGQGLPEYAALASYVFYTATGQTLPKVPKARADGFIGETELFRIYLHYKPDTEWMRSNEGALNESLAVAVAKANTGGKRCLVFATSKFMSQKELSGMKIEFCQLPFAIHRLTGSNA